MKQFFKYVFATMTGIVLMSVIGFVFLLFMIGVMMSGGEQQVKARPHSVFVLQMNGLVNERSEDLGPMAALMGQTDMDELGLDDIVTAIRRARDEENIEGIYVEGGATVFDSPATAQQVRDALADFKRSGKWVIAYADQYLQASYYVCSVADSVFLNRTGMIDFKGLGGKSMYMTGLYEQLGVKYQAARVGRYKSYVESVTRRDMSADDREQRTAYLQGIWDQWTAQMADSRHTTAEALNAVADDSIMLFAGTEAYEQAHLIDRAMYPDELRALIRARLGVAEGKAVSQLMLDDMLNLKVKKERTKGGEVAVYYAYGEIIDEPLSGLAGEHAIVGTTTVNDLQALAADDKVKAVVVRVNSGGGSAVASEQIWHAIKQLDARKPVVVSMGGAAASGGYMISCGARHIIAEPSTITGSIGIFGLIPNLSGLVTDKLGITWDGVTTNRYTDYENSLLFAGENSDEMRYMQGYTDRGYDSFLGIVAQGRGLTKDEVHEIAQGRVWLATDAVGIKLVDELGSLDDAVAKAAEMAGLGEYHTSAYPAKVDWVEQLLNEETVRESYLNSQLRQTLGDFYEPLMQLRLDRQRNMLQARLPYSVSVK